MVSCSEETELRKTKGPAQSVEHARRYCPRRAPKSLSSASVAGVACGCVGVWVGTLGSGQPQPLAHRPSPCCCSGDLQAHSVLAAHCWSSAISGRPATTAVGSGAQQAEHGRRRGIVVHPHGTDKADERCRPVAVRRFGPSQSWHPCKSWRPSLPEEGAGVGARVAGGSDMAHRSSGTGVNWAPPAATQNTATAAGYSARWAAVGGARVLVAAPVSSATQGSVVVVVGLGWSGRGGVLGARRGWCKAAAARGAAKAGCGGPAACSSENTGGLDQANRMSSSPGWEELRLP